MNVAAQDLTERQLKFGVFKIALSLAVVLIVGALIVSLFQSDGRISSVPIYALLFAVAFSICANGFLAILRIIDWFEARRDKRNGR